MHPILFKLGDWPLRSFSVMVLIGVLVAAWWFKRALRAQGVDQPGAVDHMLRNALILGFIGARITYLVVHPDHYEDLISLIAIWKGGIVSYGGFFGGALGAWLFARAWRIPFARLGDAAFPALCLGQVFGRIGCLLVGDDHGKPWDGPWAITFPDPATTEGSLIPPELAGVPLHPAQIYLSLMNLVIFAACALAYRRRRADGQVFALGMMLYATGRFLVEFTRGDDVARGFWGSLSTAQWISLPVFALGAALLVARRGGTLTSGCVPPGSEKAGGGKSPRRTAP